ncbi:hypothetical protein [Streptococcus sp. DD12]|uniref:hypothetical protein n=1 Tax=Streptococcus sp. DD12 TaxID=1777880 RepID=UPI00079279B5|nr:hypothetical protein [Streptococcus sp. DD12]KXT75589.1 hypothetical protein STRDD12_01400 [Streptococcus sp. DD12]
MRRKWWEYVLFALVLGMSGLVLVTEKSSSNASGPSQAVQKTHALDLTRSIGQSFDWLDGFLATTAFALPELDDLPSLPSLSASESEGDQKTYMIPQGLVTMEHYLLMSSYSADGSHQSLLYLWDQWTGQAVGSIVLPGRVHAGGLAYDTKHRMLWVAYKDEERSGVAGVSLAHLLLHLWSQEKEAISLDEFVAIDEMAEVSYLTYQKDKLYVGYFDVAGPGVLASYSINACGNVSQKPSQTWETPKRVQSLTFYQDMFLFSISYGNHSSKLVAYQATSLKEKDLPLEKADWVLKLPPYLEQTAVLEGKLLLLFESAGILYRVRPGITPIDQLVALDVTQVNRLAKRLRLGKEKQTPLDGIVVY